MTFARIGMPLLSVMLLTAGATAAPAPTPNGSAIKMLNHRMKTMLADIGHKNERAEVSLEPDASGLRTIVRVRVHPSYAAQLRADLTKKVNEYISIHKGDCRANTAMRGMNPWVLNPINNGVSTTYVSVPISTLMGHGNVVTTNYADGTVVNCGAI